MWMERKNLYTGSGSTAGTIVDLGDYYDQATVYLRWGTSSGVIELRTFFSGNDNSSNDSIGASLATVTAQTTSFAQSVIQINGPLGTLQVVPSNVTSSRTDTTIANAISVDVILRGRS